MATIYRSMWGGIAMSFRRSWVHSTGLLLLAAVAATCFSAATASAGPLVGVGNNPPSGPYFAEEDIIQIGDEEFPVPVVPVPVGPPWIKDLVMDRDGKGWSSEGPNSMVKIQEYIGIHPHPDYPNLPISNWHETIDPDYGDGADFKWAGGTITTPDGTFPGAVSDDGSTIEFEFPPLLLPSVIMIDKDIMWNGSGPVTGTGPPGSLIYNVRIIEQPSVPEPSSLVLAGLGLLGLAAFVRRKKP